MTRSTADLTTDPPLISNHRLAFAAAIGAVIGAGLLAAAVVIRSPGFTFASGPVPLGVIALAAGWVPAFVGIETVRRGHQRFGLLLIAIGLAWFATALANPGAESAVVFTVGLALGWLYPALLGHALLTAPGGVEDGSRERSIELAGYAIFGLMLGLLPAITFDPVSALCFGCPANLLTIAPVPDVAEFAWRLGRGLSIAWVAAVTFVVATRLVQRGPISRRREAPYLIAGLVALALLAVETGRSVPKLLPLTDAVDQALRLGQAIALIAFGLGIALEWLQGRRTRARIARVVADLGGTRAAGGLRDVLAGTLHDPDLKVGYPVGSAFLNTDGQRLPTTPAAGRELTPIVRDGTVVALLDHRTDVLDVPGQVDEVVSTARLGLEHERLQVAARAQLEELRAARRRIVADGDAVRRHLERDLHDGAQQQIVALTIALRLVPRDGEVDGLLDDAERELRLALDDLRRVAHGLYPSVLVDEGLGAAIESLAEASSAPITVELVPEQRFESGVERAAYHVAAGLVWRGVGPIRIRAWQTGDILAVEVEATEIASEVIDEAGDRVAAADGKLSVVPSRGGLIVRAELPCGS
jgi:signal transduction histidine kinase